MGFWSRLLGRAADWLRLFRGINRFYQEISMDQLRTEVARTAPPADGLTRGTSEATARDDVDHEEAAPTSGSASSGSSG